MASPLRVFLLVVLVCLLSLESVQCLKLKTSAEHKRYRDRVSLRNRSKTEGTPDQSCPRTPGELVDYMLSKNAIQNVILVKGKVTTSSGAGTGTVSVVSFGSDTETVTCSTSPKTSSCLSVKSSGVYQLKVGSQIQCVYCDCSPPFKTPVSGECWLQAQRKDDTEPQKEFYLRTWKEYQKGFGSPEGDHWLGLDALNLITANAPEMRMLYDVGFVDELKVPAFQIDNAENLYRVKRPTHDVRSTLQVIAYNAPFSTIDKNNLKDSSVNPAELYGGYWYGSASAIFNINNEPVTDGRIKRMYIKY